MSTATATAAPTHEDLHGPAMSHRQIMEALWGLLLGMFVAILSSTVVSNALPIIVPDLGGSESGYTWVVVAALLATTISTPIWGKLADLFSKKILVQIALVIFVVASAVAGLSQNMETLIAMRVLQGIGGGGLTALAQVIMATMISPRERGKYSGYLGATFALATVGGPLIGGVLTEHLSWHWCFYVGVPFAVAAFIVLQLKLKLPVIKREVHIDYLGSILLAAGVSSLLIWVSLAGQRFDWWSWQTWLMVGGGIALLALTVLAERTAPEPIIPLRFFKSRTIVLSSLASLFVGIALFGGTVFLSQYFQLARGESPTMAGVMTIPLIAGLFLSSTISGQIISRTGRYKVWVLIGGVLMTAGLGLLATIAFDTNYWVVAPYMFLIGAGVGMMMQNLVLAVQNITAPQDLGAASSFIAFTRSLGGAIGVSALGALLAHRVVSHLTEGLAAAGIDPAQAGAAGGSGIPNLSLLPEPIRGVVQSAYGSAIADVFLVATPFALLALIIAAFLKEVVLRGRDEPEAAVADGAEPDQRWNAPADHEPAHSAGPASRNGHGDHPARRAVVDGQSEPVAVPGPPSPAQEPPLPVQQPAPLVVAGTVRQNATRPLAGAQVTLADQSGRQVGRTVSDEDGRYALPLTSGGTFLLIVAAAHRAPTASLVAVGDAPVVRDVTLAGRSAITGRVLRHDAERNAPVGVPDALVTLTDVTGEVVASVRSEADGGYAFERLVAGSYVLTAQSVEHRPLARGVEVAESGALACDLALTGGGRLTGTVVAASDGRAVREATVTLVDADGQVVDTALTGGDGDYLFDDLAAGRYTLTASGYAPVAMEVVVDEDAVSAVQVPLGTGRADLDVAHGVPAEQR
ncbi:drug resistance transporter, EmrB/QacA subfamily [Friedmanniella luteola]|uniref:Drug resistance transporter, EmrB/QacA subfamily n=1 Tax=Friedmanniella luteola TaxID=546871 RepID=A0A1H1M5H3_9ACTN|nr:MFS transporter [Friedmanniella luteola]SDR81289.1 drug resistance transporter, EmrB/QacA subfamily [Friedmanniella luteola]